VNGRVLALAVALAAGAASAAAQRPGLTVVAESAAARFRPGG
jgi:hypothetical protein